MADGPDAPGFTPSGKFQHHDVTRDGAKRASIPFTGLQTLWVNTGTLCNIECAHCYIESSPTNDRLSYLTAAEFAPYLCEAEAMGACEIGFTGGEPFMNPDIIEMARAALQKGFAVLILTNAMRPAMRPTMRTGAKALAAEFGGKFSLRVSLDHFTAAKNDEERGEGSFAIALEGMKALARDGVQLAVAARTLWHESEEKTRAGFAELFTAYGLPIDAADPGELVLFPEMDAARDTPEITTECWSILGKSPADVMCANARMLIKRKGAASPAIVACTLIVDNPEFEMGATLGEAARSVKLNHPHCSRFCVIGGARCSA